MNMTEKTANEQFTRKAVSTMNDVLFIAVQMALKDESVMGKGHIFGNKRTERFMSTVLENYNEMLPAFWEKSIDKYHTQWKIEKWYRQFYPKMPVCKLEKYKVFPYLFPYAEAIKKFTPDLIVFRSDDLEGADKK